MDVRDFHPKRKGSLGEAKVAAELIRRGFPVFTEFGDLSRADLVAEMPDGRLVKVQVKCRRSKGGSVTLERVKSGPGYQYRYQPDDVDVFAPYVYDRDVLLFLPAPLVCSNRRSIAIRLDPVGNGVTKGIRHAEAFRDFLEAADCRTPP